MQVEEELDLPFETIWNSNNSEISKLKEEIKSTISLCYDDFFEKVFQEIGDDVFRSNLDEDQRIVLDEELGDIVCESLGIYFKERFKEEPVYNLETK